MINLNSEICPRCQTGKLKTWTELTADERILVERLPASAEFSPEERKRHRFCTRCRFETNNFRESNA